MLRFSSTHVTHLLKALAARGLIHPTGATTARRWHLGRGL
jgi:hypothetical protein